MEEKLEKVRMELRKWRDKRGKVVQALEKLADNLEGEYEQFKGPKTIGLTTSIVSGVLGIGALITLPVPGLSLLFGIPAVFIGAAGGATTAVATINWNTTQKQMWTDAQKLLSEDIDSYEIMINLYIELQELLKKMLPPALQEDQEYWKKCWSEILAIIPFVLLTYDGAKPHVEAGKLIFGATLGGNVDLVKEFGVVPWQAASATSKAMTRASGALTIGMLIYDVKELVELLRTSSPENVEQLRDVVKEMKKYCLSEADIEMVIKQLREHFQIK